MFGFTGFGRKPRQFEYKPRHWDPEAEEREERRRILLGAEYGEGVYKPGMYIREKRLKRMQERDRDRARRRKSGVIRTVIFLAFVVGILYLMFNYFGQSV